MELRAKITGEGQLTIPKEVRRALGIREGDSLLFEIGDERDRDEVRVRVVRRRPVSFADYAGAWREGDEDGGGMSIDEVNAYVREMRGHEG